MTGADVLAAYAVTRKAAERSAKLSEVRERVRRLVSSESPNGFVTTVLGGGLGL